MTFIFSRLLASVSNSKDSVNFSIRVEFSSITAKEFPPPEKASVSEQPRFATAMLARFEMDSSAACATSASEGPQATLNVRSAGKVMSPSLAELVLHRFPSVLYS